MKSIVLGMIATAGLNTALATGAQAQSIEDPAGFAVRDVSVSTGYASVQLPPITLGGRLPTDVLNADLITSSAASVEWWRVTPRTGYRLDLDGIYTARTRYSGLSAPGAHATFEISQALGRRWRLVAGIADVVANADQLAFRPTQASQLVEGSRTFDDLAGTVARARSPSPDLTQAALFVPISQSLVGPDLFADRINAATLKAEVTYTRSTKVTASFRGSYTDLRLISSSDAPRGVVPLSDSSAGNGGVEVRYSHSERSQLTASADWSQTDGAFRDETLTALVGYAWSGRKWLTTFSVGAALRPLQTQTPLAPVTTISNQAPAVVGSVAVGYKFQTQALLVQYRRSSHDDYGYGGRNIATGFEGNAQSADASWSWSSPRGPWAAQADFSFIQRPGNFSYIYAWLSTAGIGRRLTPNLRLMAELLFDRHGSRGFEGFDLMREGSRLTIVWTPSPRIERVTRS